MPSDVARRKISRRVSMRSGAQGSAQPPCYRLEPVGIPTEELMVLNFMTDAGFHVLKFVTHVVDVNNALF